jgi:hypothetical protein
MPTAPNTPSAISPPRAALKRMVLGIPSGERPVSLRLESAYLQTRVGERTHVRALGVLADGTERDLSQSVLWTSQSERTAIVDHEGRLNGRAPGSTTVLAICGTLVAELEVCVLQ